MNKIVLLLLCLISVALAGRYWDQWAAGNGGVHSNPVFINKPQIRWTFDFNYTYADGVLPIDNQEHCIYVANGAAGQPAFWKFSWAGQIVSSWNPPINFFFEGTIGSRNGVIYIYTGYQNMLFALNEKNLEQLWNITNLVSSSIPYSNSPLEWNEDYSIMYLSTANQIHAINAATGNIIWSTQPTSSHTYYAPLIRSTLDNTFVVKYYNNTLAKYSTTTGALVWSRQLEGKDSHTTSPPTVDNTDGSIYVTTYATRIYKIDIHGNVVWSIIDSGDFNYHSPVLFNSEYVLVSGIYGGMKLYNVTSGQSVTVFTYAMLNGWGLQLFSQPLLNREKNVLYIIYYDTCQLVALDTSNMFNFTVLWSLDTPLERCADAGPSIGSDGTIFMATSVRDWPVGLVSIGCPVTKQVSSDGMTCVCNPTFVTSGDTCVCSGNTPFLSEDGFSCVGCPVTKQVSSDGTKCVCNPAFVTLGDSCVCSDDTKIPSEDGLSCVDKPVEPHSEAHQSITIDAAAVVFSMIVAVVLVVLQL